MRTGHGDRRAHLRTIFLIIAMSTPACTVMDTRAPYSGIGAETSPTCHSVPPLHMAVNRSPVSRECESKMIVSDRSRFEKNPIPIWPGIPGSAFVVRPITAMARTNASHVQPIVSIPCTENSLVSLFATTRMDGLAPCSVAAVAADLISFAMSSRGAELALW